MCRTLCVMLLASCVAGEAAIHRALKFGGIPTAPAAAAVVEEESGDDIIPATNRIDWLNTTGVEGGINYRSVVYTNLAEEHVTREGINTAIVNCPSNQVVMLPAGTFQITNGFDLLKDGVTVRGAGRALTDLQLRTNGIALGNAGYSRVNININSGSTKDSTSIVLASAPSDLTVGSVACITELNNTNYVHPWGYEDDMTAPLLCSYCDEPEEPNGGRVRGQLVRVTDISGTTVTFTPALFSTYDNTPRLSFPAALSTFNVVVRSGIEDMTISTPETSNGIWFQGARDCWVSNVVFQIRYGSQMAVKGYFALRCTVERCDFIGLNDQADAMLMQIHTTGWRIQNNWGREIAQFFTQVGRGGGHAFVYNYLHSVTNQTTALISDTTGHGAHPQFTLVEGNKLVKLQTDSIHGSASSWTLFRNWFRGEIPDYTTFGHSAISIDSWNYHMNIVGNVLGHPTVSGWVYEEVSPTDSGDNIALYAWEYSGYNEYVTGTNSQETALVHGNYDYVNDDVVWDADISNHTIPSSMIFTNGWPAWFGSTALVKPAIGPDCTGFHTNEIPAEYRFRTGNNPP
jgi:hypothetical protein